MPTKPIVKPTMSICNMYKFLSKTHSAHLISVFILHETYMCPSSSVVVTPNRARVTQAEDTDSFYNRINTVKVHP